MALNFRYNDTTYSLANSPLDTNEGTWQSNTAYLVYKNNTYELVPASSTRGTSVQFVEDDNYYYKMDNSAPTLCFRKDNTTYYCAKSITSEAKIVYDIPAGTYTPSAFETLIKNYISLGGSRTSANAFKVQVNGQTVSVSSGTKIYYAATGVGSGTPRTYGVGFGKGPYFNSAQADGSTGFSEGHTYIVNGTFQIFFKAYANYNITVKTGINFS